MFVLASKDPAEAALAPRMALAGGVMVLGQVLTAIGVIGSTTFPSCQTSDQCERGTWCDRAGGAWSAHLHKATGTQRCHVCGDDLPLVRFQERLCVFIRPESDHNLFVEDISRLGAER